MKIALAQINPTIGDLPANAARIIEMIARARDAGAELVVFPELAICGYPPRDLLRVDGFVRSCAAETKRIGEQHTHGITAVIGTPLLNDRGTSVANSLVACRNGAVLDAYNKRLLPTYDVFDEDRYFEPGDRAVVIEIGSRRVGLAICEDLWRGEDAGFAGRYTDTPDPVDELCAGGAEIIVVPSASPFVLGKGARHRAILRDHARNHGVWVCSVNQVGANDDLIFDGHAGAFAPDGALVASARGWVEELLFIDTNQRAASGSEREQPANTKTARSHARLASNEDDPLLATSDEQLAIEALTLGVRDYVTKCGFSRVIIGLSGGIDSALTCAIAVRALGADAVTGVLMPAAFSSEHSVTDAQQLADNLGIRAVTAPIHAGVEGTGAVLDAMFGQLGHTKLGKTMPDLTQENLQSRVRGTVLMGLSNRSGALVLTTGNKSELAVGYCTLYGDMNGGLAVLSDVPKSMVFAISRHINECAHELGFARTPIPQNTIDKPPSAELAPDQLDSDSLPDYETLDEIVERHVEAHESAGAIIAATGFEPEMVNRICRLIDRNEYKRRQMATGLKITSVAFGPGRRMPIAQKWVR